ncbi:MAG: hypothetical protein H7211_06625 [Aquabacterium sp.]|nr:hypothetical protein [Ferruginibacter sp.]
MSITPEWQKSLGKYSSGRSKYHHTAKANIYIKQIKLNGRLLTMPYLNYKEIINGGRLNIYMAATPVANKIF